MLIGAWFALVAGQAFAHQSSTYDLQSSVSYVGESKLWLVNKYTETVEYEVQVLDVDLRPIDAAQWRSNLLNDKVTLDQDELVDIIVAGRTKGKYYICTIVARDESAEKDIVIRSRVCLRLWYK